MKKLALVPLALALAAACERYSAPPQPMIVGLSQGTLTDSRAPLVVDFGKPIDAATLKITLAFNETDLEGNLFDEDADPATMLRILETKPVIDGARVTLNHDAVFPVGPKLVLIVESGLRATTGEVLHYRAKVPFSYGVTCTGGATRLAGGKFFMFLTVEDPIPVQLQVFADLTVDQKTGVISGKFTSGERKKDLQCPSACPANQVCRLLPEAQCVLPSAAAGSPDEFTDWIANPVPPTGYEFEAEGCAADSADGTGVRFAPTTMQVQSPAVTVYGLAMTASFGPDSSDVVRASGTLTADSIVLGTQDIGAGTGSMTARQIP